MTLGRSKLAKLKKATDLKRRYLAERKLGFNAKQALSNARTRQEWDRLEYPMDGEPTFGVLPKLGNVRLSIKPDSSSYEHGDYENDRQKQEVNVSIDRDGLWGCVGEYFDGEQWQHADSCWGFIGDQWKNSGYDTDIMQAAIDAAKDVSICSECGRPKKKAIA